MADKPIIFSAPMVRALISGRKTQTRRIMKPQPEINTAGLWVWPPYGHKVTRRTWRGFCQTDAEGLKSFFDGTGRTAGALPARVGDRLWVREAFARGADEPGGQPWPIYAAEYGGPSDPAYRLLKPWTSPRCMPRAFSRLTLIVTGVRVEQLQEISEADARAEGCSPYVPGDGIVEHPIHADDHQYRPDYRKGFERVWFDIHGADAWEANPWVCAITFDVHRCNIDAMGGV